MLEDAQRQISDTYSTRTLFKTIGAYPFPPTARSFNECTNYEQQYEDF